MKKVLVTIALVLIGFIIGLVSGMYLRVNSTTAPTEKYEAEEQQIDNSLDGEYVVKYALKELRSTEYNFQTTIGVMKVKNRVVSYDVNISGLIKSGKSTYEIKDGVVFFDGVDFGVVVEHDKIKNDLIIDLNGEYSDAYVTLEKKL